MNRFVKLGILMPFLFWITLITGGLIHGHYDHFRDTVSEAGALGTPSCIFMSVSEIGLGLIGLLFCIGATRACIRRKISPVPVILLLAMAVSTTWAGVFPSGNPRHGDLGPVPLLVLPGILWALLAWKPGHAVPIRLLGVLSFILMCGIFLRFVPAVNGPYPGLVQRLAFAGWSVWSCTVSAYLLEARG